MRVGLSRAFLGCVFALGPVLALVAIAASASGCTTYHDELARAQRSYDANEHDSALAMLRVIEPNEAYLSTAERTRYLYLRGMTDFRLGYRGEARHYLALAQSLEESNRGALPTDSKNRLEETLGTLNTEVYSNGLYALSAHEAEVDAKARTK